MKRMMCIACAVLALGLVAMTGCEEKEPEPKNLGDAINDAADTAEKEMKDAAEKTGEAVEEAGEKIQDAVNN